MDSSTPTTPISLRSNPRLLRTKLEEKDPTESHIQSPIQTPVSIRKSPTLVHSPNPISLQDLLLLSPSPCRKSRARPRPIIIDESIESMATSSRRKSKGRNGAGASPRNTRRARRRMEKENVREERELAPFDQNDVGGLRKRRQSSRGKVSHERLALVASLPHSSLSPKIGDVDSYRSADGLWKLILELVMWKNVARSSLWFGFGTIFFMSSCLSKDVVNFSMVSSVSHLGLFILGLAFFYDSFPQRQQQMKKGTNFKLTEEDILHVVRLMLPIANAALAKSQEIFSGKPLMTLKVAPVLFFAAKYGQFMTPWRLLATGFFLSFTLPILYTCYCDNIHKKVEEMRRRLLEAWESCPRKKLVAATTATILWNLFSLKMRIFAAFISVVILRHHHQQHIGGGGSAENDSKEEQHKQTIMVAEQELQRTP